MKRFSRIRFLNNYLAPLMLAVLGFAPLFVQGAHAADRSTLVFLPVQGKGLSPQEKDVLRTTLEEGLAKRYRVYSGAEVDSKLKRISKQGCDEMSCLKQLAHSFNADLVGRAVVLAVDGGFMQTFEIKNVTANEFVSSVNTPCRGCDFLDISSTFKQMVRPQTVTTLQTINLPQETEMLTTSLDGSVNSNASAMLVINTHPAQAEVYMNDHLLGVTPFQYVGHEAGEKLVLRLEKEGYAGKLIPLSLKTGVNELLNIELQPVVRSVVVSSQPYERGARIYVDNEPYVMGYVPARLTLPAGRHLLRVEGEQHSGRAWVDVGGEKADGVTVPLLPVGSRELRINTDMENPYAFQLELDYELVVGSEEPIQTPRLSSNQDYVAYVVNNGEGDVLYAQSLIDGTRQIMLKQLANGLDYSFYHRSLVIWDNGRKVTQLPLAENRVQVKTYGTEKKAQERLSATSLSSNVLQDDVKKRLLADLRALLSKKYKLSENDETSKSLKADFDVREITDGYLLSISIVDASSSEMIVSMADSCRECDAEELFERFKRMVDDD